MFKTSNLKDAFLKNFRDGKVECHLVKDDIGDRHKLVFMFARGEYNEGFCKGVEAVSDEVVSEMEKRGLNIPASSAGYANVCGSHSSGIGGGHSVELDITPDQLEKAQEIQKQFSKSLP